MGKKRVRKPTKPKSTGVELTKVQKNRQKKAPAQDIPKATQRQKIFSHPCANCLTRGVIPVHFQRMMDGKDTPVLWELDETETHYVCRLCLTKHTIADFVHQVVRDEYFNQYRVHRAQLFQ